MNYVNYANDENDDIDIQMNIADRTYYFIMDKLANTSFRLIYLLEKIPIPIFRNRAYRGYEREYGDSWWKQFDWVKRTFILGEDWTFYRKKEVVASFGPERPSPFNKYKNDGGIIVLSSSYKASKKANIGSLKKWREEILSNPYKDSKKANIGSLKKWCEENWSLKAPNSSWSIGFFTYGFPSCLCLEIAGGGITYDEMFDIAENIRDYFGESVSLRLYKGKGRWSVDFDKHEDDEDWHNAKRL